MRSSRFFQNAADAIFLFLAKVLWLATASLAAVIALVFAFPGINPIESLRPAQIAYTPLPTPAVPVAAAAESTSVVPTLPPVWTATALPSFTPTHTATPTATATHTPSPTASATATPTATASATVTPGPSPTGPTPTTPPTRSPYPYVAQEGAPLYRKNFANTNGCAWFGISGQVFDAQGRGINGVYVLVEGNGVSYPAPTGNALKYGNGGYEITLGDKPVASDDVYTVTLLDGARQPISELYSFPTYDDCNRAHIVINFVRQP